MDASIMRLLKQGLISPQEAYLKAAEKEPFEKLLPGGSEKPKYKL